MNPADARTDENTLVVPDYARKARCTGKNYKVTVETFPVK